MCISFDSDARIYITVSQGFYVVTHHLLGSYFRLIIVITVVSLVKMFKNFLSILSGIEIIIGGFQALLTKLTYETL